MILLSAKLIKLMNVKISKSILLLTTIILVLFACSKKEESDKWSNCNDCKIDSWVGSWQGNASIYDAVGNETTDGYDVTVVITETGTNYITVSLNIPNQYGTTTSGELLTGYSVSFAGSNNSFTATLLENSGKLKLSGTAKKFYYKANELVIETVVTFDVTPATNH